MARPETDPIVNPSIMQRNNGERIGGKDGYHRSFWTRSQEIARAYHDNEWRIDTDHSNLSSLEHKYAKQFAAADKHMEERKNSWSETVRLRFKYDYDNDPLFKAWSEDKLKARQLLHIHELDEWLDSPMILVSHSLKLYTTVGGAYGGYRAYKLWQSIDQQYAKLNGLTFRGLATQEVAMGILKGTAIGVAFGFGGLVGDGLYRVLGALWIEKTVARDRRKWQGVTCAFTTAGAMGGAVGAFMLRDILSPKGHAMLISASTSLWFMVGAGVGYFIYKPFQEAHTESYDTPWWVPWNQRSFQMHGPAGIRGRWV